MYIIHSHIHTNIHRCIWLQSRGLRVLHVLWGEVPVYHSGHLHRYNDRSLLRVRVLHRTRTAVSHTGHDTNCMCMYECMHIMRLYVCVCMYETCYICICIYGCM